MRAAWPGHARDGVDRVAEEIAVVNARAAAEPAHRVPKLGVDERVDHDGCMPARAQHGPLEVRDRLGSVCRTSSNSCSGNCASSASTSRAAVSPVESETIWSSTGRSPSVRG